MKIYLIEAASKLLRDCRDLTADSIYPVIMECLIKNPVVTIECLPNLRLESETLRIKIAKAFFSSFDEKSEGLPE